MKIIRVGIDPGKRSGACTILKEDVVSIRLHKEEVDFEDYLEDLIARYASRKIYILMEAQEPRWKDSIKSLKTAFMHYGRLTYICEHLSTKYGERVQYKTVLPRIWKTKLGLTSDKQKSIDLIKKLVPEIDLQPGRCTTDHDGIAESGILAYIVPEYFDV